MKRPTVGKLVVPYMVDERIQPIDFKVLHYGHITKCATERRCGVCGKPIAHGAEVAFCGPDDGRHCFGDPWMHVACARLAMQQCPFLDARRGWRADLDELDHQLLDPYAGNMAIVAAPQARAHRDETGHWHFEALGNLRKLEPPHAHTPTTA